MFPILTSGGIKRYGGFYFNYITAEGKTGGVNLDPGTAWTHLTSSRVDNDSIEHERLSDPLNDAFATPDISNPLNLKYPTSKSIASSGISNPLTTPVPRVFNYENVLPLTSTPQEERTKPENHRLSSVRPRGLLPLELDDSSSSSTSASLQRGLRHKARQVKGLFFSSDSSKSSGGREDRDRRT